MATTTLYKDLSGEIWAAKTFPDGSVWIRNPELDSEEGNGYEFKDTESCLEFMNRYYGELTVIFSRPGL